MLHISFLGDYHCWVPFFIIFSKVDNIEKSTKNQTNLRLLVTENNNMLKKLKFDNNMLHISFLGDYHCWVPFSVLIHSKTSR